MNWILYNNFGEVNMMRWFLYGILLCLLCAIGANFITWAMFNSMELQPASSQDSHEEEIVK